MMLKQRKAIVWSTILGLTLFLIVLSILILISYKSIFLANKLDVCQGGYYVPEDKCDKSKIPDEGIGKELSQFSKNGKICCPREAIDPEYLTELEKIERGETPRIGSPWIELSLKYEDQEIDLKGRTSIELLPDHPYRLYGYIKKNDKDKNTYDCEYILYEKKTEDTKNVIKKNEGQCSDSKRLLITLDPKEDILSKEYDYRNIYLQAIVRKDKEMVSSIVPIRLIFKQELSDLGFNIQNAEIRLLATGDRSFTVNYECQNCNVYIFPSDKCDPLRIYKENPWTNGYLVLDKIDPEEGVCIIAERNGGIQVLSWQDIEDEIDKVLTIEPELSIVDIALDEQTTGKGVRVDASNIVNLFRDQMNLVKFIYFDYCIDIDEEYCLDDDHWGVKLIDKNNPQIEIYTGKRKLYYKTALQLDDGLYTTDIKEFVVS
ncbi:hypothetical protein J7K74_01045 [Candidatus Woesearchaeota archaeon]|nr:hypothetical protein [Candidatus Woesearchaeota archaeon]